MAAPIRFLSVCSGIEAASVAWEPLGWQPAAFAEIEPFACNVLAYRQGATAPLFLPDPARAPDAKAARKREALRRSWARAAARFPVGRQVPNFGDLESFRSWPDAAFDLLVGGTPCQSFSVAGFRAGLDDPRGNLALVYLGVVDRYRPRWVVWENVPGVLSSNRGRDFAAFIGGLGELGYGFAWRVLDAQFVRTCLFRSAVPQRRRRVFVVGYLGDWRPAAAVLLDAESLRGSPPPRRRPGQAPAPTLASRPTGGGGLGTDFDLDGGLITNAIEGEVARALAASPSPSGRMDISVDTFVATRWTVRRLTPLECERLQGFPDGYTDVPWGGRNRTPDGPRYKALGNSMACNAMHWIGKRIAFVDAIVAGSAP